MLWRQHIYAHVAQDEAGTYFLSPALIPGICGESAIYRVRPYDEEAALKRCLGLNEAGTTAEPELRQRPDSFGVDEIARFPVDGEQHTLQLEIVGSEAWLLVQRARQLFLARYDLGTGAALGTLALASVQRDESAISSSVRAHDGTVYFCIQYSDIARSEEDPARELGEGRPTTLIALSPGEAGPQLLGHLTFSSHDIAAGRWNDGRWLLLRSRVSEAYASWLSEQPTRQDLLSSPPPLDVLIELWDAEEGATLAIDDGRTEPRYRGLVAAKDWITTAENSAGHMRVGDNWRGDQARRLAVIDLRYTGEGTGR